MISIRSAYYEHDYPSWKDRKSKVYKRINRLQQSDKFPQEDTPEVVRDRQAYLDEFPITDVRW